jgi:hypothetical protein
MSTALRRQAYPYTLTFVCPRCPCDLERTSHTYDSEPVWKCLGCHRTYIYLSPGWCECRVRF